MKGQIANISNNKIKQRNQKRTQEKIQEKTGSGGSGKKEIHLTDNLGDNTGKSGWQFPGISSQEFLN